jgi:hypothetical protein
MRHKIRHLGHTMTLTDVVRGRGPVRWLQVEVASSDQPKEIRRAPVPSKKRLPCGQVRWLGVKWYGVPWPKRWKISGGWPTYIPEKGCGCIVKIKAISEAAKAVWRA